MAGQGSPSLAPPHLAPTVYPSCAHLADLASPYLPLTQYRSLARPPIADLGERRWRTLTLTLTLTLTRSQISVSGDGLSVPPRPV